MIMETNPIAYNTLIIDDEPLARQRLRQLLIPYAASVTVIGEAANGEEGLKLIEALRPDLLFLDIEMPLLGGFDLLKQLKQQPRVVFVTAYDQYALKAFEENSIDYLLKPVEAPRLEKTIHKLLQATAPAAAIDVHRLEERVRPILQPISSLTVKLGDRILLVKVADLVAVEAEDKYVVLHTRDGKRHLTDYTLAGLEQQLPGHFIRIHRSTIINTEHIREIRKAFNGSYAFVMEAVDSPRFKSSRSHGEILRVHFGL